MTGETSYDLIQQVKYCLNCDDFIESFVYFIGINYHQKTQIIQVILSLCQTSKYHPIWNLFVFLNNSNLISSHVGG
jgi:hypothetical protein